MKEDDGGGAGMMHKADRKTRSMDFGFFGTPCALRLEPVSNQIIGSLILKRKIYKVKELNNINPCTRN
jgi:hypothetical protein